MGRKTHEGVWVGALAAGFALAGAAPPVSQPATTRSATTQPDDARAADRRAEELARSVMKRLGGEEAWERTRYLTWNFFGSRRHLWDKTTGDVRIEWTDRDSGAATVVLMNVKTKRGRAWRDGEAVTDAEALAALLDEGEGAWINDSYWLIMPYKLRDPGVTLAALGERDMIDGRPAQVLELTFEKVGRTPQNKYHVYIADDSGLIEQWDFYASRDDAEPRFRIPWRGWKRHGRIMLSGDRGERSGRALEITGIAVPDRVPEGALTDPAPVDWDELSKRRSG